MIAHFVERLTVGAWNGPGLDSGPPEHLRMFAELTDNDLMITYTNLYLSVSRIPLTIVEYCLN